MLKIINISINMLNIATLSLNLLNDTDATFFTEIPRYLSNTGTELSNKFISEYKAFQITLRKQNRHQNSKPKSVNGLSANR